MCGFALDVETVRQARSDQCASFASRGPILHNAIRCLGLDFKVGSSGVVEIFVEELRRRVELLAGASSGVLAERESHIVGRFGDVAEGDRNARHDRRVGA